MKNSKLFYIATLIGFFSICSFSQRNTDKYTPAQAKLMAKEAAVSDAYRNLSRVIYGLTIESETLVRDFITVHDEIRLRLDPFIKGAKIIAIRYNKDGSCEVDLELSIRDLEKLLNKKVHYDSTYIKVTGSDAPPSNEGSIPESLFYSVKKEFANKTIKVKGYGASPEGKKVKNGSFSYRVGMVK